MSIPLSALPPPSDETRRDQWGRYLVVPPGGDKSVGYTRVTTVAGTLDSGGGLAPWKATMTAVGLMLRRGLRAQWEALIAEHDGDPWYASPASKKACKKLVEECAAVGGANDRAEMGTSLHAITALVDLGRTPTHLQPETEADINAYVNGLAAAGVTILPGMVEVTVALDDHRVAGTFDRLVQIAGWDLPVVADLKTGADLSYSYQSIAVQLSAYSRADSIYQQGPAADGSEDVRLPMPAVDQHNGLIMWLNAGSGQLELIAVDLDAGWEAFEHSVWTRGWRKTKVDTPLAGMHFVPAVPANDDQLIAQLQESIDRSQARHPSMHTSVIPPAPAVPAATLDDHRAWLQERIDIIGRHDAARTDFVAAWPGIDTPPPYRANAEQLDRIEAVVDSVEARHSIPFGRSRPGGLPRAAATEEESIDDVLGQLLQMFPNSTIHNEETPS